MAEPIVRKFVIDTAESEQNLKELNTQINATSSSVTQGAESINKIAAAENNVTASTKSLKAQLRELQAQLAATDPNSDKYRELAIAAGEVKDQIQDAAEAIGTQAGGAFERVSGSIGLVTSRLLSLDFAGAADGAKLFATNLNSVKLGDLSNGLKNVGSSFLSVGRALLTNPLFLIGGAIVLIATNITKLAEAIPAVGIAFKAVSETIGFVRDLIVSVTDAIGLTSIAAGDAIDAAIDNRDRANKELDNQRRLAVAKAREAGEDIDKINQEFQQKRIDDNKALIKQIDDQEATGVKLTEKQLEERQKLIDENTEFAISAAEREANEVEKARNDAAREEEKRLADEQRAAEQAREKARQKSAQALAERKSREKEVTDAIKASQEEQFQSTLDAESKELRQVALKYNDLQEKAKGNAELQKQLREQELIELQAISDRYFQQQLDIELQNQEKLKEAKLAAEKAYFDALAQLQDEEYAATLSAQDQEELAVMQKYDNLFALAGDNAARQKEITDAQEAELNAIREKYRKEDEANADAKAKADKQRAFEVEDAKLQAASDALGAINGLVSAFAKGDEKRAKAAFKIQKAVSIAQATVDTYKGANAIFASAAANPATVLFPAQPFIAAGVAIASGLANVATIAQQQFQGGTSPGANNETAPNLPGDTGGGSQPAQFNPLAASFLDQRQEQITPRAYVLAGDVASAAEVRENVADLARIG